MTIRDKIKQLVRPEIQALAAYHVPPAAGMIKLDAMENPWPWPPALRNEWLELLRGVELNRYPDPTAQALQAGLRDMMQVPQEAALLTGNGSDELIQMIIQSVAKPGSRILAPEPTFVMYRHIAAVCGLQFVGVPLRDDFSLDAEALLDAIDGKQPAVVFLAWPNNPTGNLFDSGLVQTLIGRSPGLVVVDEAYAPFTDASFMPAAGKHDNLLVLRTVSKLGLAGLRLGLLAGPAAWLQEIDKTRLPYNLGTLNQVTGAFAARHHAVFAAQAAEIRAQRSALFTALQSLPGLRVYPSEANFILFRVPPGRAVAVHLGLQQAGILIKQLHGSHPQLQDCLRVTVGLPDENRAFLAALEKLLD